MGRARAASALVPFALLVACSEDYGAGSSSSDASVGEEGSVGGDASASETSTNDAGAAANLAMNADFALGCAAWQPVNGAGAEEDPTGRTGSPSCKLCVGAGLDEGSMFQKKLSVSAGETYAVEIWLRAPPGSSTGTEAMVYIEVYDASAKYLVGSTQTWLLADDTWKRNTSLLLLPAGASAINVTLSIRGSGCVLFDDAALTRQ